MTSGDADALLDSLLRRCTFPPPPTQVTCGLSGGPDSSALVALAAHAGLDVTAVHVDHGLRAESSDDALAARRIAERLGVSFRCVRVEVTAGPNLEARAREARLEALGPDAMTGHTIDDQAETVVLGLIRGSGAAGLSAMQPGPQHPILRLRRADTHELCRRLGLDPAHDVANDDARFRRVRVRRDVLPLLDDVADRDTTPLLARTADLVRDDDALLEELAADLDVTDARTLAAAPLPLARRAIRRWLLVDGYPPDAATVERVLAVARGDATRCDVGRGRSVHRSAQRLALFSDERPPR